MQGTLLEKLTIDHYHPLFVCLISNSTPHLLSFGNWRKDITVKSRWIDNEKQKRKRERDKNSDFIFSGFSLSSSTTPGLVCSVLVDTVIWLDSIITEKSYSVAGWRDTLQWRIEHVCGWQITSRPLKKFPGSPYKCRRRWWWWFLYPAVLHAICNHPLPPSRMWLVGDKKTLWAGMVEA